MGEFRLSQRLELTPRLEQKLLQKLEQRLKLHIGHIEKQLLEKVEFVNVDFDQPGARYHTDMLGEFIFKQSEKEQSFASRVLQLHGVQPEQLEKVVIEGFEQEDISMQIGTKRNVDRALLVLEGGKSIAVTLSLDKNEYKIADQSPSLQEAEALSKIDNEKTWSVQRLYGARAIVKKNKVRGFVVKEFLDGTSLSEYIYMAPSVDEPEAAQLKSIAQATGRSITNGLETYGGVPRDANPLNWIVNQNAEKEIIVRNCDVEGLELEDESITHEIRALGKEFGSFESDFRSTLPEKYK